ncbi:MAG: hypothetical protein IKQ15_08365 [Kiritimatiellae bacterium]|nr:hypothetical protein [Kiritimatiellia bacterium]
MQVEYKFVTWEGNPDRAVWMVDQVADYLSAMVDGLDHIAVMMNDASKTLPGPKRRAAHFDATIRDVEFVKEAAECKLATVSKYVEGYTRALAEEESRAAKLEKQAKAAPAEAEPKKRSAKKSPPKSSKREGGAK